MRTIYRYTAFTPTSYRHELIVDGRLVLEGPEDNWQGPTASELARMGDPISILVPYRGRQFQGFFREVPENLAKEIIDKNV